MSMQYAHEHNIAVSMGFSSSSTPSTQIFLHKTDTRQGTADVYARGARMNEANTIVDYGCGKVRKASSPVSSLSPPQSTVTGLHSQPFSKCLWSCREPGVCPPEF
ncbi:hypothetical protein GOP47_0030319 [Adiantum capillus-veneris]|nr:hypothetical protein GOP47_0030319 [Adiantum capillus-veneris]